ncbi:MAG: tyrosine-type recombinase/integrase [Ktedonobacteraceae bacterium]|nr:tyrosine-type recombinase/integrase [Ktedonobacteraceae bacterium]
MNAVETWLTWFFESQRPLDRETMAAYRGHLSEKYKNTTAQRLWSIAYRLLEEMVNNGYLPKNPARGLRGFKTGGGNYSKHVALTKEQVKILLSVIPVEKENGEPCLMGLRDRAIIILMLTTGLRRSECAILKRGQLTMRGGHHVLLLREGETKNDDAAMVKVIPWAWRSIEEFLQATGRTEIAPNAPLFVAFDRGDHPTEAPISAKVIYKLVKKYAEQAEIEGLLPHGLRASFITLALEADAPLYKVMSDARHAKPETTLRYHKRQKSLDRGSGDYVDWESVQE